MITHRTSAPYQPYTHERKPQRETLRKAMFGELQGANDNRDWSARFFVIVGLILFGYFVVRFL